MKIKRSQRHFRLSPRCRLAASRSGSLFQGFDCSSNKAAHELGLKRRKPVLFLSEMFRKNEVFILV